MPMMAFTNPRWFFCYKYYSFSDAQATWAKKTESSPRIVGMIPPINIESYSSVTTHFYLSKHWFTIFYFIVAICSSYCIPCASLGSDSHESMILARLRYTLLFMQPTLSTFLIVYFVSQTKPKVMDFVMALFV